MLGRFNSSNAITKNLGFKLLSGIVETSLAVVETGVLTGHIRKSATRIHDLVSSTASASEEMSATVQGIASNASEASASAHQVSNEVHEAVTVMSQVTQDMGNTASCMQNLEQASREIQEILSTISEISDQTNLLALNAAIEAARAGDAGRGFAVVADEVRKLSNESQKSTVRIRETVVRIQSEITQVNDAVQKSQSSVNHGVDKVMSLKQSAESIQTLMENIAHSTKEQSTASSQISESIYHVSEEADRNDKQTDSIMSSLDHLTQVVEEQRALISQLDVPNKVAYLAQADHALWKKKIVDFDMGRIQLSPADAGSHINCRLGQWYYEKGKEKFGDHNAFNEMEHPHKRVHEIALQAIERRQKDPSSDLSDLIEHMEDASTQVIENLKTLAQG